MQDIQNLIIQNQRFLILLLVFIVFDMLTGIIKAILSKTVKSSVFREGLLKKALEVILVIIGFALDWACNLEVIGIGVTSSLVIMEGWSIIENIEPYVPIPKVLKDFLESAKQDK